MKELKMKINSKIVATKEPECLSWDEIKLEEGIYKPIHSSPIFVVIHNTRKECNVLYLDECRLQPAEDHCWGDDKFTKLNKTLTIIVE